jgi:hypothetical protein
MLCKGLDGIVVVGTVGTVEAVEALSFEVRGARFKLARG